MTFLEHVKHAWRYTIFTNFVLEENEKNILAQSNVDSTNDIWGPDTIQAYQARRAASWQNIKTTGLNGLYIVLTAPWVFDVAVAILTSLFDAVKFLYDKYQERQQQLPRYVTT